MTTHRPPHLLSVPDAAALLGIKEDTLRHWLCDRRLRFYKVGGRTLLKRQDLEAYLDAQAVEPEAPLPSVLERRRRRERPGGGP